MGKRIDLALYDDYQLFRTVIASRCVGLETHTLRMGYVVVGSHIRRHFVFGFSSMRAAVGIGHRLFAARSAAHSE